MIAVDIAESYSRFEMDACAFIATRESLLSRLRQSENDGWREFFDTYWKLIYYSALRHGLSDAEAQEVVQETMIGVSRNLPSYVYKPKECSFKSWLMNLTQWRITDQMRRRCTHAPLEDAENVPDDEKFQALWNEDWERNLVNAAMERVRDEVNPADFQIFGFCVLQRKGVAETARFLNISAARVYLARHRISRAVRKEVEILRRATGEL